MDKDLGPLPFVIGVTGHRDLRPEDVEPLKKVVGEIIDEFQQKMPHTPLAILSALADGADRLVAEVALEKNVRVIVSLPMKQSEYETDFDLESREEFRSLLTQVGADNKFELPLVETTETDPGKKRNLQYAQVGQYIVLHSHLVLALWDGLDPHLVGGTADVVKMCLSEGRMEELSSGSSWLNYEDECGPVYQVLTRRVRPASDQCSTPDLGQLLVGSDKVADKRLIYPDGKESVFNECLRSTEQFNRDYDSHRSLIEQERSGVLKEFDATDSCEVNRRADLVTVFVAADQLAVQRRRVWERTVLILHIVIGLSVCAFAALNNLKPLLGLTQKFWAISLWSAFLVLVVLAFGVWRVALWRRIQNRFFDYRGLAEALRIQFYWNVAGIHDVEVADCYLRHQLGQLGWIRTAVRVCCIGRVDTSLHGEEDRLHRVLINWVKEQSGYLIGAVSKRETRARTITRRASLLVVLATAYSILMLPNAIEVINLGNRAGLIKMMASIMFGVAALMVGYAGVLAMEEEARQFRRMQTIYDRANKLRKRFFTEKTGTPVELTAARTIISELGKEALEENGDWIVMHRNRPLKSPRWETEINELKKYFGGRKFFINRK